jgi:hypothetical protein
MAQTWLDFRNWVKIVLVVFVIGIAAIALFIAALFGVFNFAPSDAKLIRAFARHRATFDRLVAMSDSDARRDQLVATFGYADSLSLPPGRSQAYGAAFDTLHLTQGLQRKSGDTVILRFEAWGEGFAGMGRTKGYLFSRTPPRPVYSSLDNLKALTPGPHRDVYRAIAPHWYLYYEEH